MFAFRLAAVSRRSRGSCLLWTGCTRRWSSIDEPSVDPNDSGENRKRKRVTIRVRSLPDENEAAHAEPPRREITAPVWCADDSAPLSAREDLHHSAAMWTPAARSPDALSVPIGDIASRTDAELNDMWQRLSAAPRDTEETHRFLSRSTSAAMAEEEPLTLALNREEHLFSSKYTASSGERRPRFKLPRPLLDIARGARTAEDAFEPPPQDARLFRAPRLGRTPAPPNRRGGLQPRGGQTAHHSGLAESHPVRTADRWAAAKERAAAPTASTYAEFTGNFPMATPRTTAAASRARRRPAIDVGADGLEDSEQDFLRGVAAARSKQRVVKPNDMEE
jgi:hypothetical protein